MLVLKDKNSKGWRRFILKALSFAIDSNVLKEKREKRDKEIAKEIQYKIHTLACKISSAKVHLKDMSTYQAKKYLLVYRVKWKCK